MSNQIESEQNEPEQLDLPTEPIAKELGEVVLKTELQTTLGPFRTLPEYKTVYPEVVATALGNLFAEYNQAFVPLVEANREWDTDYQYAMVGPNGSPINFFVQVDMVGLPEQYLQAASSLPERRVREDLRRRIFEIENSLAMYQLLQRMFSENGEQSAFDSRFRGSLDAIRQMHNKPIALLAVTDQKHQAMRETEFGRMGEDELSDREVMELSGFDAFLGPREFLEHIQRNNGNSDYLLYVRSSDPVARLRDPNYAFDNPLLSDPQIRRIIKAYSITFNIDDPDLPLGAPAKINDTKAYLPRMRMAEVITDEAELDSAQIREMLKARESNQGEQLQMLRAKPLQGSYGCYGHLRGTLSDRKFRQGVRKEISRRGPYIVQPEMLTPVILNESDGQLYTYIDRNFLATDGRNYRFIGGSRSLMPLDSEEYKKGRNHGSKLTTWGEITG